MTIQEIITGIDGPQFGRQREVLTRVIDCEGYRPDNEDLELLEGLRNLLDFIADYCMDELAKDCSYGPTEEQDYAAALDAATAELKAARTKTPKVPKNYGTNSERAFTEPCEVTAEKHRWQYVNVGRCLYDLTCKDCGAKASTDASD